MTDQEKNHSFLRSYIRGETLFGFWNLVSKGLGVFVSFLLIAALSVHDYGVFILVLSLYAFAGGFFLDILYDVILSDISRFLGEGKEREAKKLFLENVVVRVTGALFLTVSFFLGAEFIASHYSAESAQFIRIIAPMFLLEALYGSMKMLIEPRLKFSLLAIRPVIYKVLRLGFIVAFIVFSTLGVREALIVHVAASAFTILVVLPSFLRLYAPWRAVVAAEGTILWPILKTYGRWPVMGQIISQTAANIRPWLIKFFVNTEAVALFSVAESIFGAVKAFLPSSTLAALVPRAVGETTRAASILLRGTKLLTLIAVVLVLGSAVIVPPVIVLALPHYIPSLPLFLTLLLVLPILAFRIMGVTFLVALREQRYLFLVNVTKIVASILLPVILLYFFGVFGMALERILEALIVVILVFWYLLSRYTPKERRMLYTFDARDFELLRQVLHYMREAGLRKFKKFAPSRL